jgi:hypothetical protein
MNKVIKVIKMIIVAAHQLGSFGRPFRIRFGFPPRQYRKRPLPTSRTRAPEKGFLPSHVAQATFATPGLFAGLLGPRFL